MKVYSTAKVSPRTRIVGSRKAVIGDFTFISCRELHMGEGACINRFCEVQGRGVVHIGDYAQIASHTSLVTSSDTPWGSMCDTVEERNRRIKTGDIRIGKHAYIGPYVTIMPGVEIGDMAVVGAYSYIASDVKPGVVVHPKIGIAEKPRMIDPRLYDYFGIEEVPTQEYYEQEELMYEERVLEDER